MGNETASAPLPQDGAEAGRAGLVDAPVTPPEGSITSDGPFRLDASFPVLDGRTPGEPELGRDGTASWDTGVDRGAGVTLPGFVLAPAGVYTMGSPAGEDQAQSEEQPSHVVSITRSFLISDHEVTQREWREVMGDSPSYHKDCGEACPVEGISWYAALMYANTLSDAAGLARCYVLEDCIEGAWSCASASFIGPACPGYRLPTEAEWEYAARAGTTTPTQLAEPIKDWWICRSEDSSGTYTTPLLDFCHYVCSQGSGPAPVRSLLPNAWGIYDMAGNVAEWVWDAYAPYDAGAGVDPIGPSEPASGGKRVARGTSYAGYGPDCRHARRASLEPDWASSGLGFRVVRTLP